MIQIRALQHYLYCPHRWGLLYLEGLWQDNSSTVKSGLGHNNVHLDKTSHVNPDKICCTDVSIYSTELGIYGKTDMLEFVRDDAGTYIDELDGKFAVNVIEYKPTAPKNPNKESVRSDCLQLYAQCCCLKELFGCDVTPYIFYIDTHRRVKAEFTEEDRQILLKVISDIEDCEQNAVIPKSEYGEKCNGCSMAETCMPKLSSKSVKNKILDIG
ncbi:MAG: CRISPR-associated protein Cas4 [Bacteroidales bacterium]|nr:CRISPR-associated protein Cas4 [Bacteroidales bacterium]